MIDRLTNFTENLPEYRQENPVYHLTEKRPQNGDEGAPFPLDESDYHNENDQIIGPKDGNSPDYWSDLAEEGWNSDAYSYPNSQ